MPVTLTTRLPAIEDLIVHPGSDELRLTWTGVDNGTLVIESSTGAGWTTRATVDVTAEAVAIDAAPLATGEPTTLRATVETEHATAESVAELLTLTLPVVDLAGSVRPVATVGATSPTPRSLEGSATPDRQLTTQIDD